METINIRLNSLNATCDNYTVAIGNFDGLHYGHRKIIDLAKKIAYENKTKLGIMSFDITPRQIVNSIDNYYVLRSFDQKFKILESFDVDALFLIHFNNEVKEISASDFVEKMIIDNNIKFVVCGFDFKFGKNQEGDINFLKKYDEFETIVLDSIDYENEKIGSSKIHEMIIHGEIEKANNLLVSPYSIIGKVISGNKKGRTIGYPTANILPIINYRIPQQGVYATKAIVGGKEYNSMTNIGHNPTFNFTNSTSIETNIFDFDQDIYGQEIEVVFKKCIRRERIFDNVEQLIKQLESDKKEIINYFK